MTQRSVDRRDVLRGIGALGASSVLSLSASAESTPSRTPFTRATYKAVVDAVVPRTPELAGELGEEHVPGGLDVGLDDYLITFVDTLFTLGSVAGTDANLPLADPVAVLLDSAAAQLVASGEYGAPPSLDRVLALLDVDDLLDVNELAADPEVALQQSLFAGLSRDDRLRAIEKLDAVDVDSSFLPGPVAELDVALIGQLVVGFTEVIYYSEWQGYEDITDPPGDRGFSGTDIQSWAQTGFPGVIDGAPALRGYWSKPGSSLGSNATWETIDIDGETVQLREAPGEFTDNEYETSGYREVYATDGTPAAGGPVDDATSAVTGDAGADAPGGDSQPLDGVIDGLIGLDTGEPGRSLTEDVVGGLFGGDR